MAHSAQALAFTILTPGLSGEETWRIAAQDGHSCYRQYLVCFHHDRVSSSLSIHETKAIQSQVERKTKTITER